MAQPERIFEVPRLHSFGARLLSKRSDLMVRLGNIESGLVGEELEAACPADPIFVCGLARSGTTILLELLSRHTDLASQRYLDFPFLFTPWLWNRYLGFATRRPGVLTERSHKDGLMVSPESPEAMEEPLWMHFFPHCHDPSQSSILTAQTQNPAFEAFYRAHMAKLIRVRGKHRYLAKGNYHFARLGYLKSLFPKARFVIPVRDPVQHIASSMKQHKLFTKGQQENPDARLYLAQVGHFEFGLDRRPVNVDAKATDEIDRLWTEGKEVEGWARYWAMMHEWLAQTLRRDADLAGSVMLVSYNELCGAPEEFTSLIAGECELERDDACTDFARTHIQSQRYYEPDFTEQEISLIRDLTGPGLSALEGFFTHP